MSSNLLWRVILEVLAGMPMPFIHLERRMNHGGALAAYEDDCRCFIPSACEPLLTS